MSDTLITVNNASKKFCRDLKRSLWYGVKDLGAELTGRRNGHRDLRKHEFWALRDVSFELRRGESLGLIGRNGAGKSTLLRLLNGLIKPDQGRITMRGRIGALIELGAGFNPILTGRENIYNNAAVLGLSKKQIDCVIDEIIDFAGIDEFIDAPVQSYSSGMRVRLGFAVAAHLKPDVLLVDEVLAVGDMAFRRKCLRHMLSYIKNGGALVFVSHNMQSVQSLCNRSVFLDRGQLEFEGTTTEAVNLYFETQQTSNGGKLEGEANVELSDENPVVIEEVEICPSNSTHIRTGESVRVVIHYRSIKNIDPVIWNFSIWTEDQQVRLTTATSQSSNINYQVIRGKGQLRCTIPKLILVPGTYAIKAAIFDLNRYPIARFGWENSPVLFTVKGSVNEVTNARVIVGDLFIMNIKWDRWISL